MNDVIQIDFAAFAGKSSIGYGMDINEDYIFIDDQSYGGKALLACIADGSGSRNSTFNPAIIVSNHIRENFQWLWKSHKEIVTEHAPEMIESYYRTANDVLVAFKLGDEQNRGKYASTLITAFIEKSGYMTFAHAGNSRMYLIRSQKIMRLTNDHTDGWKMVKSGKMAEEDYYRSTERLSLYNGLGVTKTDFLKIDTGKVRLMHNDVIIMSTDGLHYAVNQNYLMNCVMTANTVEDAAEAMIAGAERLQYRDNISVNVIWYTGYPEGEDQN